MENIINTKHQIHIIGGGMAGSEAAWQLAQRGISVRLSEMRGSGDMTPAHQTDGLAELVCSNSFRSDDHEKNAVGLIHHEMRQLDSLIMAAAEKTKLPAGSALAVDREEFSRIVTETLENHPNITVVRERVDSLPESGMTIIATGPSPLRLWPVRSAAILAKTLWHFSMRLRPLFIATALIWTYAGWRAAGTRVPILAMARIILIARWTRSNIWLSIRG